VTGPQGATGPQGPAGGPLGFAQYLLAAFPSNTLAGGDLIKFLTNGLRNNSGPFTSPHDQVITFPATGVYWLQLTITNMKFTDPGSYGVSFNVNGTALNLLGDYSLTTSGTVMTVSDIVNVQAGDALTIAATTPAGSSYSYTPASSRLMILRLQ
jgi:hypothetical protein